MAISKDTNPDAQDFTDSDSSNKPGFAYKGGNAPESAVLKGLIEPHFNETFFDSSVEDWEVFLTKRQIGGKKIEGRKIAGWKEVPTVLDWDSTYRHSEWFKNFSKVYDILNEEGISGLVKTEELNGQKKAHNHAVCVFLNSFFAKETKFFDYDNMPDESELVDFLTFSTSTVQRHAQDIYLNDEYKGREDDSKVDTVEIDGEPKKIKYNEFKISTYEQLVELWFEYLDMMEQMKVYQVNMSGEKALTIDPEHRWKQSYTEKMLAKFKDLEESRFSEMWTTMLTLTTYQDKEDGEPLTPEDWEKSRGPSWFEAMERLRNSLDKTLDILRQVARRELETDFHYIWVVEAHNTGYPHIHIAIFGDVSEWLATKENELRLREILEQKHDLGKEGVAASFDTKPPEGDGAINSISNYLVKYFKKNFGEIQSKYEDEDLSDKEWGTLAFNACMFTSGYRTWGTSKEVGSVMKTERHESKKTFNNLGGELAAESDRGFRELVDAKGDDLLKERLRKRDKLRSAIKIRQND